MIKPREILVGILVLALIGCATTASDGPPSSQSGKTADSNVCVGYAESLLHAAAKSCDLEKAISAIQAGADVNAKSAEGKTALHLALALPKYMPQYEYIKSGCQWNNIASFLDFMLTHEADVNVTDGEGNTPLHYSAS